MTPTRGAAYWLWEEEQSVERAIAKLLDEITDAERRLEADRTRLADLRLVGIEMRAARSLIEASGLKVEMRDGLPNVSLDKVLTDPEPAVAS